MMGMGTRTDYNEYDMSMSDALIGYGIGGAGAFLLFCVFYSSWVAGALAAIPAGILGIRVWKQYRIRKQKEQLLLHFKDFLEALSASYSAGNNTLTALTDSTEDLAGMYGENDLLVRELRDMLLAYRNGQGIEAYLYDLSERSGLEDIRSFADVFDTCNRKGADMRQIIQDTRRVIIEKIEMEEGIRTLLAPGRSELRLMMIMPVVMILIMNGGGLIPSGTGTVNLVIRIVAMAVFGVAYLIGRRITDIKL